MPVGRDLAVVRALWRQHGYARIADPRKREAAGSQSYKKGYELRFVVVTTEEERRVRQALADAGIRAGRSFEKHRRIVIPVYGRESVLAVRGTLDL